MTRTGAGPDPPAGGDRLAPFAAWLETRVADEGTRRRHREVIRHYLAFAARDRGAPGTLGCRFVVAHCGTEPAATVRAALDHLAEYDELVRRAAAEN